MGLGLPFLLPLTPFRRFAVSPFRITSFMSILRRDVEKSEFFGKKIEICYCFFFLYAILPLGRGRKRRNKTFLNF